MPVTNLEFALDGCGRSKVPYKGIDPDLERSWKGRLIMEINCLALFAASVN